MARRITTISLDEESYEQAKQIGNLSSFIRQALQDHADLKSNSPVDYHNAMVDLYKKCHPHKAQDGYCSICWPYGQPTKNEWHDWRRRYLAAPANSKPIAPRQSADRRKISDSNQITEEKSSETRSDRVGILRKLLRFLI